MLIKFQLHHIFLFVSLAHGSNIILKLESKQIIDSILSDTSSMKYLTKLAQVFAKKAAETFFKEINDKEHLFDKTVKDKLVTKEPVPRSLKITQKGVSSEEIVLNEDEAYKLLEKPYPDGDNLGWHSQEDTFEEEDRNETKAIPVYGLMKINGIYVRRWLGVV